MVESDAEDGNRVGRGLAVLAFIVVVVAAVSVVLARRNDSSSGSTTSSEPVATTTSAPDNGSRTRLDGFGEVLVQVRAADGRTCEACMLLAETSAQRARGLMEVTDRTLGGYDGMLFSYSDRPGTGGFWMRNTRIPLTSVFFDPDGRYLDSFAMTPCPDSTSDADCPRYGPDEPFGTVVELAALEPVDLLMGPGSTIEVKGSHCPAKLERSN
ncbi:MAG: DUF192 domain-containing protein [Acidimicrobiales bacterium]|nr:DUF192 domain-containing protein [Acidimicrobiales bacterium]